jgi:hypothetical protein
MPFSSSIQSSVFTLVAITPLSPFVLEAAEVGWRAGDHRAEAADQAGQRAGDDAGELAVEHFRGRAGGRST